MAFRVLGIDPGLQTTGYGVIEAKPAGPAIIEAGVIKPVEGRGATDLAERVRRLYTGIGEVIDAYRPTAVAVEQLYAHYAHPRTAILMAHARGVLLLAAAERSISVTSYAATRVKLMVTGHGRASKQQVQRAVQRELRLAELPEPADVADALAVALTHYHLSKNKDSLTA
jgi:crossover junction endodeoxyribonuclease RuvC